MNKRKKSPLGEVKKLTTSAMMCAMTVVLLAVASFVGDIDLTVLMLSSLLMVFVYVEIGPPYTYLTWLCSSLLSFIFFPSRYFWVVYFFLFGFYPILKGWIEKTKRPLWWLLKFVWLNITLVIIFFLVTFILGADLTDGGPSWMIWVMYGLSNLSFICYDILIGKLVVLYVARFREKILKFFSFK